MTTKAKNVPITGVHERLTNIMQEVCGVDLGSRFDGQWVLSAKDRASVRATAARLEKLMDEYEVLDRIE